LGFETRRVKRGGLALIWNIGYGIWEKEIRIRMKMKRDCSLQAVG